MRYETSTPLQVGQKVRHLSEPVEILAVSEEITTRVEMKTSVTFFHSYLISGGEWVSGADLQP